MPRETNVRAAGIVIKKDRILLVWRKRNGREYYVFPGGGVEKKEKKEHAVLRELEEETTVKVKVRKLLYKTVDQTKLKQYFYLCQFIKGKPTLSDGVIEAERQRTGKNLYKPQWIPFKKISKLYLYPLKVRDSLIEDLPLKFRKNPKTLNITVTPSHQKY